MVLNEGKKKCEFIDHRKKKGGREGQLGPDVFVSNIRIKISLWVFYFSALCGGDGMRMCYTLMHYC